jgi:hypothetical protein
MELTKVIDHANSQHTEPIMILKCCFDVMEAELRESIAQDIMIRIEAPIDISSDWYAATKRTKMAAASIAKGAE